MKKKLEKLIENLKTIAPPGSLDERRGYYGEAQVSLAIALAQEVIYEMTPVDLSEPTTDDIPDLVAQLHDHLHRLNLAIAKMSRSNSKEDAMHHVSACMDWARRLEDVFTPPEVSLEDVGDIRVD